MLDHNMNKEQEIVLTLSKSRSNFSPFLHKDRSEITRIFFFFCTRKIIEAGKRQKKETKTETMPNQNSPAFRAFSYVKVKE